MGNALTAVGGDLGSIGLNPAGSAVAGYTQFVITPSLSITATKAQGYDFEGLDPIGLGDRVSTGYTRAKPQAWSQACFIRLRVQRYQ